MDGNLQDATTCARHRQLAQRGSLMVQVLRVALRDQPTCAQTTAFLEQRDPAQPAVLPSCHIKHPAKPLFTDKAKVPQVIPSSYTHLWRSERVMLGLVANLAIPGLPP